MDEEIKQPNHKSIANSSFDKNGSQIIPKASISEHDVDNEFDDFLQRKGQEVTTPQAEP
jgi:hypothetical protein